MTFQLPRFISIVACLPLLLVLGCPGGQDTPPDDSPPDDTQPTDDTDQPPLGPLLEDLQVEVSTEVPTVARLRWSSREGAEASVRFGVAGELASTAVVTTDGDSRQAYLLGLLPDGDYAFEVTVSAGDESESSGEQAFATGSWPVALPQVSVSLSDPEASAGGLTIVPLQESSPGGGFGECWTTVLDGQGRMVWASPISCPTHRARLALDGSGFISHTHPFADGKEDGMVLEHVSFFGERIQQIVVPDGHHDFTLDGSNTYGALGYSERTLYGDEGVELRLVGDTIIELDSEGGVRVLWDVFDHVDPVLDQDLYDSIGPEGGVDWSHGNYLNYVAAEDAYYLSCRGINALFKVDRSTGELLWTLADGWGDFANIGDGVMVDTPHSIEVVDGGLLIFNQWSHDNPGCSEAVRIQLDEAAGTAERVWSYESSDCLVVDYLGNAWPLSNGNTLVDFGFMGLVEEVTPGGEVVQRMSTPLGWFYSYGERVDSLYVGQE